jgi:hypothetical protein
MKNHTFLHNSPLWSSIGPEIPNAVPLNHQNVKRRIDVRIPKMIAFVFIVYRFEEKIKWSRTCDNMRTAK